MISKTSIYFALVLSAATNVYAVPANNDWTKPCFQGDCSFDVQASNSSVPATLRIWGSSTAISDVTEAGGWIILGCDKGATDQDIRMVCKSNDATGVGCDHIHDNGAEDTIVRLPESCGQGPFARVARAWISEDQQVPDWAKAKINLAGKRSLPQVQSLALSTDFASAKSARHGPVNFALVGTSAEFDGVWAIPQEVNARRGLETRGLFSKIGKLFGGVKDAVKKVAKTAVKAAGTVVKSAAKNGLKDIVGGVLSGKGIGEIAGDVIKDVGKDVIKGGKDIAKAAVKDAVKGVKDVAEDAITGGNKVVKAVKNVAEDVVDNAQDAAKGAKNVAGDIVDKVGDVAKDAAKGIAKAAAGINDVKVDKKKVLPPIDVNKSFNLITADVDCGKLGSAQMKVDADVKAHADISLGILAAGTLIPPKVKTFSLQAGLNADINGAITVAASASGSPVDTGEVQLFTVGIPGLDIPGVFQIGPAFAIKGRANLDLSMEADMVVNVAYKIENAAFAFPPNSKLPSSGAPTMKDSPLSLSVSPSVTAKGSFSAHLIPEINFGISALGNVAKATVFLNLDSSATLGMTLTGGGDVFSTNIGAKKAAPTPVAKKVAARATPVAVSDDEESDDAASDVTAVESDFESDAETEVDEAELSRRAFSASGCVDMTVGIDAKVGAEGSFFGLFDAQKDFSLFKKDFELFKKCFGNAKGRRSTLMRHRSLRIERASTLQTLAARKTINIKCPIKAAPKAQPVVNETIKANAIKSL